jgi:hypothetical protein
MDTDKTDKSFARLVHPDTIQTIRCSNCPPSDPIIKTYLKTLQHPKSHQVTHELGLKGPFQNLPDKAAKKRGWTLVPELSTPSGGKRVIPLIWRSLRQRGKPRKDEISRE